MIRRPPRSTLDRSSAASDVYKRQVVGESEIDLEVAVGVHVDDDLGKHEGGSAHLDVAHDVGQDELDAVSYTHLRAHETVLDLVCRLLLEKKK
mgnify:CR=1 FL=1